MATNATGRPPGLPEGPPGCCQRTSGCATPLAAGMAVEDAEAVSRDLGLVPKLAVIGSLGEPLICGVVVRSLQGDELVLGPELVPDRCLRSAPHRQLQPVFQRPRHR